VGVEVEVGIAVGVTVAVAVGVTVAVGVGVVVGVGVSVAVAVGEGCSTSEVTTSHPLPEKENKTSSVTRASALRISIIIRNAINRSARLDGIAKLPRSDYRVENGGLSLALDAVLCSGFVLKNQFLHFGLGPQGREQDDFAN